MSHAVQTQTQSFFGKVGPLVLARGFTALLTLSIPLVLARTMALSEYGTYKQLFLILMTLYYVLPFGMAQALYFFVPRAEDKRPYFGQTLLFLTVTGAVAAGVLGLATGALARHFHNPDLANYRWSQAVYLVCMMASFTLEISLMTQGRTKQAALAYLVSDAVRALAMVVPVLLGYGLHGLMVAVAAYAALRYAAAWTLVLKSGKGALWNARFFKEQLVYAAPFGAAMLLGIPQQYAHQFAVSSLTSPEAFAIYAVACFQLPIVDLLYTPISEVLMVRLGELDHEGRVHEGVALFRESVAKLSLAFFPLAAFLCAAAPEFIGALFGQKFLAAVPLFRVSVLGVALSILPVDGVLRARKETRHIFRAYLVKALATVPLVYFGVKGLGMMGGILSWVGAEAIGKAVLLSRVPRALSSPGHTVTFRGLLPRRELLQALGAAVAAGLAIPLMRALSPELPLSGGMLGRALPLVTASLVFALGYLVALQAAGVRPVAVLASFRKKG
ncbi:oligosaccharide flippase family protein [Aggregicoccus sp. 17bor-14]|uniref:lipopolysaccharide biosynthesis protein n=1 Tax=Myxococcaceae TaxID=31 RepID=UPI00129C8577|nr:MULTISPECIES: oligosaccharide flippase family protein [Myxococcaceae]MBF5043029.1 oligosaccharide flippase family protein [Simulacricoccus sp. 17bor-14]MRI88792.1 oligosaccharide flippase family protein [Aggregicoccus sp. 17bor-14]